MRPSIVYNWPLGRGVVVMVVKIRDGGTDYQLEVHLNGAGDLVLQASDMGATARQMFGASEYEYWYFVRAPEVGRVCLELGVGDGELLQTIRDRLAPQGIDASRVWKEWLLERSIPYEFKTWRS